MREKNKIDRINRIDRMNNKKRIKIVAVGNTLRGDDGVGPAVIERLRFMGLPENIALVDVGADPLDITEHLVDVDKVIVIDAARMGAAPGELAIFHPEDISEHPGGNPFSTHAYGLAEGFELARALGCLPEDVHIIGVQPEQYGMAAGLSSAVAARIPEIIKIVMEEVLS